METVKLQKDLREFIELLNSNGVEYVVVGAHAVAYHGHPRFTGDLDLLVRSDAENAGRIMAALRAFGFGASGLAKEDFLKRQRIVQLGRPPNRIDLITSISGVDFEDVWRTRVTGTLDGIPVAFIGREALLANKRATGRTKDLADVEALEGDDDAK
jgi:hypothetical protein